MHVHVMGNDGSAKYVWSGNFFILEECYKIKAKDLKKISAMVDENKDIIIRYWEKYFGKNG